MPRLAAPGYRTFLQRQRSHLLRATHADPGRLEERLARHPVDDACIQARLDVEADTPVRERRAADPGPGVRDAEIGGCLHARVDAGGLAGSVRRELRLVACGELDLARRDGAPEQLRERAQGERDARKARPPRRVRTEGGALRVAQPRGEPCGLYVWPLTPKFGVI